MQWDRGPREAPIWPTLRVLASGEAGRKLIQETSLIQPNGNRITTESEIVAVNVRPDRRGDCGPIYGVARENCEELATLRKRRRCAKCFQMPQMGQSVKNAAAPIGSTGPRSITSCYRDAAEPLRKPHRPSIVGCRFKSQSVLRIQGSMSRDEELESSLYSKISALSNRVATTVDLRPTSDTETLS